MYTVYPYAPNEAFLKEVEVALAKATSSEPRVLLVDFNASLFGRCCPITPFQVASTRQPGKVLLGNIVTLTLTKTEGAYGSSVPPMDCP